MIRDARQYPRQTRLDADLCVIGAGPAGLTIARHFANSRHRLILIESGDVKFARWPQKLSRESRSGQPYEPLDLCRVRRFGGTTGRMGWGGWCKPMTSEDFTARQWVGIDGWPIDFQDLASHYAKAAQSLHLPPDFQWDPTEVAGDGEASLLSEPCALTPRHDFGGGASGEIAAAPNIEILLNATAVRLKHAEASPEIASLVVRMHGRRQIAIRARFYILACGGIENARLLLASNDRFSNGIGNRHDLVGRFFMEHPHIRWGHFQVDGLSDFIRLHDPREAQHAARAMTITPLRQHPCAGLTLNPALQEREGLLRSRSWIKQTGPAGYGAVNQALQDLTFWPRKGRIPPHIMRNILILLRHSPDAVRTLYGRFHGKPSGPAHFSFDTILEQEPDPANRITLDRATDPLGLPRVRLELNLSPLLRRSFERTQEILTQQVLRLGAERGSSPAVAAIETQSLERRVRWVRHHMGTTRMGRDARSGVVNPDCRIFDVPNLYVAGSSVFPTGGNDMPTMTIVALSHRLAEHLNGRLNVETR